MNQRHAHTGNQPVRQVVDASDATRASLLERLKNLEDQSSWQEFFDSYWRLIYDVALKAGLTDAEAQDVVQETVAGSARHLPNFHYDRKVCSFKTWLLRLARWRIIDQIRKRIPSCDLGLPNFEDDPSATALLDRLTGGTGPDLDKVWNGEWEKLVLAEAIKSVKGKVRPETYQMFDLYGCRGMPVAEVARLLGVSTARVYVAKHRVAAMVKREVHRLEHRMAKLSRVEH